jgi:DNA-binding beta-propeller fold protein YncE
MHLRKGKFLAVSLCVLSLGLAFLSASADVDDQLMAKRRVFPTFGPGLRALRCGADGKYYLLAAPNVGIVVFDAAGKQLKIVGAAASTVPPSEKGGASISFAEDLDVDAGGNLYIADRGSNAILVFSPEGKLLRSISFNSPASLAVLPEGEVAVTGPRGDRLVTVFDAKGRLVREFGDPEPLSERMDLNRFASNGRLASDPEGHLYYGYTFMPEPLVRMYDRFGFAKLDFQFTNIDALTEARAMRREIQRQEKRTEPPALLPLMTAFGVDPVNGDLWMALHNTLLHFDRDGNRRSEYQIYTKDGARIEADVILVEENRLLIGADPLGIYEFARPDRAPQK